MKSLLQKILGYPKMLRHIICSLAPGFVTGYNPVQADQFVITPELCTEFLLAVGIGGLIDNVSDGCVVMPKLFGKHAGLLCGSPHGPIDTDHIITDQSIGPGLEWSIFYYIYIFIGSFLQ